ncbi:MAG: hypothetical protein V7K57_01745 [Nostoc sp.]
MQQAKNRVAANEVYSAEFEVADAERPFTVIAIAPLPKHTSSQS